jgi:hypothetical protein
MTRRLITLAEQTASPPAAVRKKSLPSVFQG